MKKTSEIIRERIKSAKGKFHSNDNIADFIEPGEMESLQNEVQTSMQQVLESLVIDTENDHNTQETAKRVAKMFLHETFGGRYVPEPRVTSFPNMGYNNLYTTGPITIRSTCAHHFQNIVGQEEMTTQIAEKLVQYSKTPNVAVVVKAEHHCMTHRGVKEHESDMTTAIMLGKFREDSNLKQEFYNLMLSMKGHK